MRRKLAMMQISIKAYVMFQCHFKRRYGKDIVVRDKKRV
jgi:hypothetical protein